MARSTLAVVKRAQQSLSEASSSRNGLQESVAVVERILSRGKSRTSLIIGDELDQKIEVDAAEKRLPKSVVVNLALARYLSEQGKLDDI